MMARGSGGAGGALGAGGAAGAGGTATGGAGGQAGAGGASDTGGGGGAGGAGTTGSGGNDMVLCNPVTNEPCSEGEACDVTLAGGVVIGFECYPPPNETPLCGDCNELQGPYCHGGATCNFGNKCARWCCDDGDCGTGVCKKTAGSQPLMRDFPELGICSAT